MRIFCALPLAAALLTHVACVRQSPFECSDSAECGEGICEATGFCSFYDSTCEAGRRYGEYADPGFADACVAATAAHNAIGEISPRDVAIGSVANRFTYQIELTILQGDTGVDRLDIAVPPSFGVPLVSEVIVNDAEVLFADKTVEHGIAIELAEPIVASASIAVVFDADARQDEDSTGLAFRSTVSDSQTPAIAPTELTPRTPDSWLVTTSIWVAASEILAELSPNQASPDSTTSFTYDMQIVIGDSNTGVDSISLQLPDYLLLTTISSVLVEGEDVAYSEGSTSTELLLADKILATSNLRLAFDAEVVACSNDRRDEVTVTIDDSTSAYAAQPGIAGNADGHDGDDNSQTIASRGAPRIYWADRATAKIQSGVDGSCPVVDVISGLSDPRLVAADFEGGKLYWADVDAGQIWRANLDGSDLEILVTGVESPGGVAVDPDAGKLYWTDHDTARIQRSNLDGSSIEALLVHGTQPSGIKLDLENQKMYWADTAEGTILRAGLDGSNVVAIISGLDEAADVAIAGGRLYATGHAAGTIIKANLDGTGMRNLVTGQSEPVGLAFDVAEDRLYWADSGSGTIRSSNANGNDIQDVITGLSDPQGIILGR